MGNEDLGKDFLENANKVKLKSEEKFDLTKAAIQKQFEENKNKGLNNTSIVTMIIIGVIIFMAVILLYATDFQASKFENVFDLYKVGVSVIMLILSLIGYVLFGSHGILSYRSSLKFNEKLRDRNKVVEKIKDPKHFKVYKNNISHRNKISKLKDTIDSNLRQRYGIRKFFFKLKDKIFDITGKWSDVKIQLEAYIKWLKVEDEDSEESKSLLEVISTFNMNNFKLKYREWRDDYFISGNSASVMEDNSSLERNTLRSVFIRRGSTKVLIWVFLTVVTSFSVTEMAKLGLRDSLGLFMQLLFVTMTCLSGYKDSYITEEGNDESKKDSQMSFVNEYNIEYAKDSVEREKKLSKELDNAHYYAEQENRLRDKGEYRTKSTNNVETKKDIKIIDLKDYCKNCLKLSKMCDGYAENDYKAPNKCDKRELAVDKDIKKEVVRPLTYLERMEKEK